METPLYTIEPFQGGDTLSIYLGLGAGLLGLTGMILLLRRQGSRKDRNYRMLGAMLLFFVFLIGSSTAFFSWLAARRIGPVSIYAEAIATPYGTIPFSELKNAEIRQAGQRSLVNPNRISGQKQILLIEEKNGKVHAFSEDNYRLQEILAKLRTAVEQWKNKGDSSEE